MLKLPHDLPAPFCNANLWHASCGNGLIKLISLAPICKLSLFDGIKIDISKARYPGDAMSFKLVVNGQPMAVDVPGEMPLLWAIRDILNLRGTKYGCGIAVCGACTVHINGAAVRSCVTQKNHHH